MTVSIAPPSAAPEARAPTGNPAASTRDLEESLRRFDAERRTACAWLAVGFVAFALSAIARLVSVPPASAGYNRVCWGVTLAAQGSTCISLTNDGLVGLITEVDGNSPGHSVCVLAWYRQGIEMWSAGPNQGVYNTTPRR